ncbi:pyridoxal phosphate-dependent aminotransferase [Streptomyces sp. NPDC051909]|uniref:pyridoxal phosphate-dependent aminotransferase n=1 Tax=Streptomyces sp. NPDC051909 TaxID=3154944 RepID=UPI00341A369D
MEFTDVLSAPDLPTRFSEVRLVHDYLDAGSPGGAPIYLSLGETWSQAAPGLTQCLASPLPQHSHGYVVSQYGLPRLQRILRSYIPRTHGLPDKVRPGVDFEVAVACGGTRNTMSDFARLLNPREGTRFPSHQPPVALLFSPSWDYATVFAAAGYDIQHLPLSPTDSHPSLDHLREAFDRLGPSRGPAPTVLVINAQHNPTAINWRPQDVRTMIRMAITARAAILVDDAYFAVHNPDVEPTSALRILLEEAADSSPELPPWLAVRSMGKQFNCNGWGIGAATGPPAVIDELMNTVQFERSFIAAVPLQEAMSSWLEDPESDAYLIAAGQEYANKRKHVAQFLSDRLGYPQDSYQPGECTSYLRFQVPPRYLHQPDGAAHFRTSCFQKTGVLLSLDPGNLDNMPGSTLHIKPHVRMFIGPPLPIVAEALNRLENAGIHYDES